MPETFQITLSQIRHLADIVCELDGRVKRSERKIVSDICIAHAILEHVLKDRASEVYAKDEDEN